MPEYLAPGVYVEEVSGGIRSIEGVSTSVAGFVGVTRRGPVRGLPVLVTSYSEFVRRFGGGLPESWGEARFLAYAVRGFFENGGQRCYIKRVPGQAATHSVLDADTIGQDAGPGRRTGIHALADVDDISLVAVPGITSQAVQQALIQHCERLKNRFALLDPPAGLSVSQIRSHRSPYDTKYAALYYPRITVYETLLKGNRNMPPSGHIAGIYARVDTERGVHKAPANEEIRGIVGLERTVGTREQDILNPHNINALRDFRASGKGFRVSGARCLTSDTTWKYVNVRRLFIFLEESLSSGTQWAVFEPNEESLWARLRQSIEEFLFRLWRNGVLPGARPEQAFFVRCDRTTMTQDDIDNGRLIMLVGIAPIQPAEYVLFRIGQWAGGSSVEEE